MYLPAMPIFLALVWLRLLVAELAYTVPNDFDALYSSAIDALGFVNEDLLNELAYHLSRKLLNVRVLLYQRIR